MPDIADPGAFPKEQHFVFYPSTLKCATVAIEHREQVANRAPPTRQCLQ